jgi:hypothetical protein
MAEIVVAEAEHTYAADRYYSVRAKKPFLSGTTTHSVGAVVKVPERVARELISSGCAEPHGLTAAAMLRIVSPERPEEPRAKPAPGEEFTRPPNIRIVNDGSLFQDGRSYTKQDGPFYFRGDVLQLLALQSPQPGSDTEAFARQGARRRVKIEPLVPLSLQQQQELAKLRVRLSLPTPA